MFSSIRAARSISRSFSTSAARHQDLAKLVLIGRLGADPEVRVSKSNTEYITYTVATTNFAPAAAEGERPVPKTSWHRIGSFSEHTNKYLKNLKKGTTVYVEAFFEYRDAEPSADPSAPSGQRQVFLRHDNIRVIHSPRPAVNEEEH